VRCALQWIQVAVGSFPGANFEHCTRSQFQMSIVGIGEWSTRRSYHMFQRDKKRPGGTKKIHGERAALSEYGAMLSTCFNADPWVQSKVWTQLRPAVSQGGIFF
jgi:hypothetical protein